jgi:hypothetical protein
MKKIINFFKRILNIKALKKMWRIYYSMEEIKTEPEIKIKLSRCDQIRKWQAKNPEKMKLYREKENMKRREKRRLFKILL